VEIGQPNLLFVFWVKHLTRCRGGQGSKQKYRGTFLVPVLLLHFKICTEVPVPRYFLNLFRYMILVLYFLEFHFAFVLILI